MSPQSDSRVEPSAGAEEAIKSPRERVIEDIRCIASTVDPAQGLTLVSYREAGGRFSHSAIFKCGRWRDLCDAAGVCSGKHLKKTSRRVDREKRRERIIQDIRSIVATVDCSQGLTHRNYAAAGGRFTPKQIAPCGGWMTVCRLAGVQWGVPNSVRPARKPALKAPRSREDLDALRTQVIEDIASVAGQIQHPSGLSFRLYRQGGGLFHRKKIQMLGRWKALCHAAGVSCGSNGGERVPPKEWKKTAVRYGFGEADAALDLALGIRKKPSGPTAVMGWNPRASRSGRFVRREVATPTPSDIIADIRAVAWTQGLASPNELEWHIYRHNGGLFSLDDTAAMGGFIALRRDAAREAA